MKLPFGSCKRQDEVVIRGRVAEKWLIEFPEPLKQVQWLDKEHGFVVKSKTHNGGLMELQLTGHDTFGGRVVEKWVRTTSFRENAPVISYQWYDPVLKLVVKEELPGGYVRELAGIRTGAQPDQLFQVPAEYRPIVVPGGQAQANKRL